MKAVKSHFWGKNSPLKKGPLFLSHIWDNSLKAVKSGLRSDTVYVVLSCLLRNLLKYTGRCAGDGFNGWNILFLLHRCTLLHYFSFLIQVYIVKNCSNFQQLLHKVLEEWVAVWLLIGIEIPINDVDNGSPDLTGESFNGQKILIVLHRCALFREFSIPTSRWFCSFTSTKLSCQTYLSNHTTDSRIIRGSPSYGWISRFASSPWSYNSSKKSSFSRVKEVRHEYYYCNLLLHAELLIMYLKQRLQIIMNIKPSPSNIRSMKTKLYGKCIKLDGLQVESSIFNHKVFRPVVGISKSVSPVSTVIIFWLIILRA
jgi:hypothetical protein